MSEANSNAANNSPLVANTRPTKKLLIEGITRDLSLEACIFDLIDNAIDAKKPESDGLIEILFDGRGFSIKDCGCGISLTEIQNSALRFGTVNLHPEESIGAFGIGLNRAVFKIGRAIKISSETKLERVYIDWDIVQYMENNDVWEIPVVVVDQTGEIGTLIEVGNLNDDVSAAFSDKAWEKQLISELSIRYGLLIKEAGFTIKINGSKIPAQLPEFRQDSRFKLERKDYTKADVSITIQVGQHHLHKFKDELGYIEGAYSDKKLISEYGWTVYCNNRAILLNDWSHKTGWDTDEHTQYYGFVGVVHFKGESNKLPWSTSKADVDLHSAIYADALKTMRQFSKKWRSHTNQVKEGKFKQPTDHPQLPLTSTIPTTAISTVSSALGNNSPVVNAVLSTVVSGVTSQPVQLPIATSGGNHNVKPHPAKTTYLFGENKTARIAFNVPHSAIKIKGVVKELQTLEVDEYPCAVMLLLRVLIEESCKFYKNKNLDKPDVQKERGSLAKTVMAYTIHMEKQGELSSQNDGHVIANIKALCGQRGEQIMSIEYLQTGIHASHSFLGSDSIRSLWRDIEPFIVACFK